LLVQGALACDDGSGSVRDELAARRHAFEGQLRERLRRAKAAGQLPKDTSAGDLARFYWTVCNGMAVQAAGGATREQLRRVVTQAMRAWPTSSGLHP
jgi:hypothetical protein